MEIIFLIGRLIVGWFFLTTAYSHIVKASGLIGYAKYKKVPMAEVAVYGTGVLALLGGLAVTLGLYTNIGLWALIVFMVGVTFGMHQFWSIDDAGAKSNEYIAFRKNMAILGLLLMMLALNTPWVMSLSL
ncbi:MAG: DoxX family protein [Minisyncoccia bacterium]